MTNCPNCHASIPRRPRCFHGQKPVKCGNIKCLNEHLWAHRLICTARKTQYRIGVILLKAAQRMVGGILVTTEEQNGAVRAVDVHQNQVENVQEAVEENKKRRGQKLNQKRKPHRKAKAKGKQKAIWKRHRGPKDSAVTARVHASLKWKKELARKQKRTEKGAGRGELGDRDESGGSSISYDAPLSSNHSHSYRHLSTRPSLGPDRTPAYSHDQNSAETSSSVSQDSRILLEKLLDIIEPDARTKPEEARVVDRGERRRQEREEQYEEPDDEEYMHEQPKEYVQEQKSEQFQEQLRQREQEQVGQQEEPSGQEDFGTQDHVQVQEHPLVQPRNCLQPQPQPVDRNPTGSRQPSAPAPSSSPRATDSQAPDAREQVQSQAQPGATAEAVAEDDGGGGDTATVQERLHAQTAVLAGLQEEVAQIWRLLRRRPGEAVGVA